MIITVGLLPGDPGLFFFFSCRRRHTSSYGDWSSDVCSSDLRVRTCPGPLLSLARRPRSSLARSEGYGARRALFRGVADPTVLGARAPLSREAAHEVPTVRSPITGSYRPALSPARSRGARYTKARRPRSTMPAM